MKSSYFNKLSALVLSVAICMSFMPFVSATAYAADGGEWYLLSMGDENTYDIALDNGADAMDIDVRDWFIIEADEGSADPMDYDSFAYQWEEYSYEEEGYIPMEDETNPVLTNAEAGSYRCIFTNKDDDTDYGIAYFNVYDKYDGEWGLIDDGEYRDYYGKDGKPVILDAESKIDIWYEDEESEDLLTKGDFEYQWFEYTYDDEEDSYYKAMEGETGATLTAPAKYGEYRCRVTNTRRIDDYRYAYFYVSERRVRVTGIEFSPKGVHEVKEYTNGRFRQDGRYDDKENFIPQTDYYFYYGGWGYDEEYDYYRDRVKFNLGDKLTLKYEDNTSDVYTYQTNTYTYKEDGETWTESNDEFTNSEGQTLRAYITLNKEQTYATRLGVGARLDAMINYYNDYDYEDEDGEASVTVKDFAQIVKNPGAAWINGAFYRLNEYEKSADLRGFYSKNPVTEFKIPAKVAMGDGKEYPVRHMSPYIWEYNSSLKQLTVPASVHTIEDFAFGLTSTYDSKTGKYVAVPIEGFTLYATTGSAAYEYAKEYGIKVVDNNPATNGNALAEAKANAEAKAKEAEEAKANAAAKAAEAEAAKNDSGSMAKEVEAAKAEAAAAKAEAEAKAKEAEAAKNEVLALKAQLKKIKGFKATAKKKGKAQINWKKTAGVTGYQVYRSTKKTSGFKKVATIKKVSTLKWNDKKLKKGKKYYYKVRTYTTVNGKNYYGQWSEVKMIKGKK